MSSFPRWRFSNMTAAFVALAVVQLTTPVHADECVCKLYAYWYDGTYYIYDAIKYTYTTCDDRVPESVTYKHVDYDSTPDQMNCDMMPYDPPGDCVSLNAAGDPPTPASRIERGIAYIDASRKEDRKNVHSVCDAIPDRFIFFPDLTYYITAGEEDSLLWAKVFVFDDPNGSEKHFGFTLDDFPTAEWVANNEAKIKRLSTDDIRDARQHGDDTEEAPRTHSVKFARVGCTFILLRVPNSIEKSE